MSIMKLIDKKVYQ